jgi:hypothetical protein
MKKFLILLIVFNCFISSLYLYDKTNSVSNIKNIRGDYIDGVSSEASGSGDGGTLESNIVDFFVSDIVIGETIVYQEGVDFNANDGFLQSSDGTLLAGSALSEDFMDTTGEYMSVGDSKIQASYVPITFTSPTAVNSFGFQTFSGGPNIGDVVIYTNSTADLTGISSWTEIARISPRHNAEFNWYDLDETVTVSYMAFGFEGLDSASGMSIYGHFRLKGAESTKYNIKGDNFFIGDDSANEYGLLGIKASDGTWTFLHDSNGDGILTATFGVENIDARP